MWYSWNEFLFFQAGGTLKLGFYGIVANYWKGCEGVNILSPFGWLSFVHSVMSS